MKRINFSKILGIILLSIWGLNSYAQLDTKHYIPPVFGREDFGCHYLVLSTPSDIPFDVTIKDGSGNFIATQTISSFASSTYNLGCGNTTQLLTLESELNTALTNKGFILEANEPFYTNLRIIAGPQAGSLTSKGVTASLGTDFRAGFMFNNDGQDWRKSNTIGILATEDNTVVNFSDIRPGVVFEGTTPTGSPLTSPDITVTLNEGESYVIAAFVDNPDATENTNGMNGIHVTSDKPIVMNTATWLGGNALQSGTPGTGRDLGIDQIVSTEHIGSEYVVLKGEGIDNERVIVVPTLDGTEIFLNDNATAVATVDAGEYYVIEDTEFSPEDNLFITTSNDAYIYQTANGGDGATDDNERQCGLNFLPPVGCTGGKAVFLPNVDFIGEAQINIIADAGATVYVDGVDVGAGDPVTGTSEYVTYKLNNNYTGDIEVTSDELIRVSLINLSGHIGAAGYFSGFTKDIAINTQTINSDNIAKEGCVDGIFHLFIGSPSPLDTEIEFTIAGTATNGIDYEFIDNTVIIPAGQTSASITIEAIQDGFAEGQESIYLIYEPEICSGLDTATLYIDDAEPIEFTILPSDLGCFEDNSGEILFNATGGTQPYTYHIEDEDGNLTQTINNPTGGLAAGTYMVQVYDVYGCKAEALIVGGQFDAGTTFLPDGNGVTYTSVLPISGFGAGETITDMSQLQQICANMEHSWLGDLQIKIIAPSGESVILKDFNGGGATFLGEPIDIDSDLSPGIGYDYCFNDNPNYGTMVAESMGVTTLPAGSYESEEPLSGLLGAVKNGDWTIEVTDYLGSDNGYIFYWNISILGEYPDTIAHIFQPEGMNITGAISQSTCGESNGAIDLTVTGAIAPYTFLWSNGATTEDIGLIPSGSYEVTVTDGNGCSQTETFLLNSNSSLSGTANITDNVCFGGSTGAIDMTTTGGTAPYTFNWDTGANTEDISGLSASSYIVTISDAGGCQAVESFTVGQSPEITIASQTIENEICGTSNGSIDIEVVGGSGSYGYTWSTGAITQDVSGISGGNYTLTITDGYGCEITTDFTVQNDVTNCSSYCFLTIESSVTEDYCGNNQGAIDVTIVDATNPYIVEWSHGPTVEDLSNLAAGDYTITVTDANNCQEIAVITVGNNTGNLSISNVSISNEICGNDNGSIDITAAGGTLPYTFNWDNGANTEDISGLSAGTYVLEMTDGNNCELTQSFDVDNNTGTLAANEVIIHEICDNNQGSIDQSITGNNGALSYLWNTGANTEDLIHLTAGDYSCTITDASGCELIVDYTINNSPGDLAIINSSITNETCGQGNGAIDIVVTGGDGNYTYLWSNDSTTEDLSNLSEGSYTLVVTDGNGCQVSTGSMYVFNTGDDLSISTLIAIDEICGNGLGSIDVNVSGGDGNYTYNWNTGAASQDLINISEGTYYLTVTDGNNCQQTFSESISNDNGTLTLDNSIITHENCGQGNGAIDLQISGGTAPYNYIWNSGQTSEDLNNISEGTYTCTITDINGCEITSQHDINNLAGDLAVSHIATAEICSNGMGSIDITVTGSATPYTFAWSNGDNSEDLNNLSAGTYSCVITDNNGCSIQTGDISIINNASDLSTTAMLANDTCNSGLGFIELTTTGGTPPYTFVWSNGANTEDNSGLNAGSYTCTLTDANGCEIIESFNIENEIGSMSISSQIVNNEVCNDNSGSIDLTVVNGSTPYTFLWSNSATTEDIIGLDEGNYTCTITDANGCELISNTYQVNNETGDLAVTEIVAVDEVCGNSEGAVNLTVIGTATPITYLWNNGDNTEDISSLSAGIYTCTITDNNGCSLSTSATVNNNAGNLSIYETEIVNEACDQANGSIDIFVVGGTPSYNFSWSNGASSEDISGLIAGSYSVVVTDQNGCTQTYNTTIENIGTNFAITNVTIEDEICNNGEGLIDITLENGTLPYSYNWSNGAITEDLSGLSEGTYDILVSDANGCTTNESYTIINNTGTLSLDGFDITDETCGQANGMIDLTYSGGNEPVSILWSNGNFEEDLEDISAGFYSVTITDQYGCSLTESGTVSNITGGFAITDQSFTNSICGDSLGSIDITVTGGSLPYTFAWSNGANTEDLSNLWPGDYELTLTDANGCEILTSQTIINETTGLSITDAYTGDDHCSSHEGYIDLVVSGGATPYTFLWNNGATTEDLNNISEGDYYCVVTDNAGCSVVSETYTISNTASNLSASSTSTPVICTTLGTIDLSVSNGFAPYTFDWDNMDTTEDIFDLTAGTYTVTITDVAGCTIVHSETVDELPNTLVITNAILTDEICMNGTGSIDLSIGGGTPTYQYAWDNGESTEDISGLSAGDYEFTLSDANGCELTEIYTINNDPSNLNIDTALAHHINCNNTLGWIDMSYSGGAEPVSIIWSNGETEEDPEDLSVGIYTVTITDANSCQDIVSAEIFDYDNFEITNMSVVDDTCSQMLGSIDLSTSGGMQPIVYSWNNGETTEDLNNIGSDYYQCIVSTADGCELNTGNVFVDNIDGFAISEYVTHSSCSSCDDGAIDITINGNGTMFTYSWTGPNSFTANTGNITDLLPGMYTLTVVNDMGCELVETYEVSFISLSNPIEDYVHITAYPNPTYGQLTVKFDALLEIEQIRVLNLLGQEVMNMDVETSSEQLNLDLSDFAFGTYHIQLISKRDVHTIKVVHQKE